MDFKSFFEQNKKACVGGLAGVAGVLLVLAAVTGQGNKASSTTVETAAASTEASEEINTDANSSVDFTTGNFYEKLAHNQPVSILVIGDGFARGTNLENVSNSWAELIASKLETGFSADIQIDNYSLPSDNTAYSGYVMANEIPEGSEYDAVILSFGNYDDPETFSTFYESMVRSILSKCPETSIISLIEPASVTNTDGFADDNASAIQTITDHYHGLTIDIAKLMEADGKNASDTAQDDKINQNEDGNIMTADIILKAIRDKASEKAEEISSSIEPLNESVSVLESYTYIPAGDFVKVDDTTFEIPAGNILDNYGDAVTGLLGVDFDYQTGSNDVYVSVDGTPFGRSTVDFNGTDSEQHIVLINDNFAPAQYVTVSFGSAESAASFAGIVVSGNVTLPDSFDKFEKKEIKELSVEELDAMLDEAGDTADGGPGSGEDLIEADEVEETTKAKDNTLPTKYVDGVLYEQFEGEWYEVINDDTGNPNIGVKQEVVETRSAGNVITNKEVVKSADPSTAESIPESSTAILPVESPVPESVAETQAAEIPMETQAVSAETAYDPVAAANASIAAAQ
ncbi:SGNH/GDSL hydrolase family protein [Oribacterium sp. WCC10]|uniref:SGNH/GDSL hydrolase family protein n=1 Tax=Oribacterium sp. WCC10 TaxID=1855343 RepID=UPI0008ECB2A1|nr:SGNH/GDSL hydrolase family protein [Oribacterium sp. WCC10]SFG06942.1 GDSL-like Lipase/Acylhydrolase family protein [Oribacterium sp. WCC10]